MSKRSLTKISILAITLSFFSSCDEKPKNPVAEYGDALINSYQRGQNAGEKANLDAIMRAVQAYHAAYDKYPQSLDEVKGLIGREIDLSHYDYKPDNGTVFLKE
jgi:hypothetical protein